MPKGELDASPSRRTPTSKVRDRLCLRRALPARSLALYAERPRSLRSLLVSHAAQDGPQRGEDHLRPRDGW